VPINHTRDVPGLMARRVDDIALLDDVIVAGGRSASVDLKGMRVGLPGDYFLGELDSRVGSAFIAEVARLADLGVVFVEASPPDFAEARSQSAGPIMAWEMPRDVARYLEAGETGLAFEDVVHAVASPYVKSELKGLLGGQPGLKDRYQRVMSETLPRHRAEYKAYLRDNDLGAIAFPTTPLLPAPIGENDTVELDGRPVSIWLTLRNSVPATLLGAPCLSLPIGPTDEGLPVGLELDGWPQGDGELLSIGLAWEQHTPQFPAPSMGLSRCRYLFDSSE
jgi:Asp-tRNA(Asn)/Glu-tRNA(Gln) amidotransferase A subunit family amidase